MCARRGESPFINVGRSCDMTRQGSSRMPTWKTCWNEQYHSERSGLAGRLERIREARQSRTEFRSVAKKSSSTSSIGHNDCASASLTCGPSVWRGNSARSSSARLAFLPVWKWSRFEDSLFLHSRRAGREADAGGGPSWATLAAPFASSPEAGGWSRTRTALSIMNS